MGNSATLTIGEYLRDSSTQPSSMILRDCGAISFGKSISWTVWHLLSSGGVAGGAGEKGCEQRKHWAFGHFVGGAECCDETWGDKRQDEKGVNATR